MRAIVIDETIRCILEEGFAAASAKHITERAGVTWGVVQYHFGAATGHALRRRGDDRMNPVGAHSANQCSILARCSQARSASRF
jgi:AcrR family transcriptional regulator